MPGIPPSGDVDQGAQAADVDELQVRQIDADAATRDRGQRADQDGQGDAVQIPHDPQLPQIEIMPDAQPAIAERDELDDGTARGHELIMRQCRGAGNGQSQMSSSSIAHAQPCQRPPTL
ncbi:hypothetical protein KLK06_39690 [Nonomuraea sp. NEAU-A123]|nr:hypothetical protein [Nonomuraea sp. NEAU-A123]MBT2231988.1 hypothetical protein [Nonomuraea sp. NEAU-A123]